MTAINALAKDGLVHKKLNRTHPQDQNWCEVVYRTRTMQLFCNQDLLNDRIRLLGLIEDDREKKKEEKRIRGKKQKF